MHNVLESIFFHFWNTQSQTLECAQEVVQETCIIAWFSALSCSSSVWNYDCSHVCIGKSLSITRRVLMSKDQFHYRLAFIPCDLQPPPPIQVSNRIIHCTFFLFLLFLQSPTLQTVSKGFSTIVCFNLEVQNKWVATTWGAMMNS